MMKKRIYLILFMICIGISGCGNKQDKPDISAPEIVEKNQKEEDTVNKKKLKEILEKGEKDAETIDFQGFLTAFQNLSVFDTPEAFFTNTEEMERFFYNTALVENTKYEIVEQGFLEQGFSQETSKERYELLKQLAETARKMTEEVYLGKSVYNDSDEKFVNKYAEFQKEMQDKIAELNSENKGDYDETAETLQLGETERGGLVVSTYKKFNSLDTGMKWSTVEEIPHDDIQLPPLTNSEMVYGDYFEKFRTIANYILYEDESVKDSGFTFLTELKLVYDVDENNWLIQGSPEMILNLKYFNNQVDIQDMRMYFNSDEELADYYLDAMVKCMQVLYNDFGITEEMRMNLSELIKESLSGKSSKSLCYVAENNEHMIIAHGDTIIFR